MKVAAALLLAVTLLIATARAAQEKCVGYQGAVEVCNAEINDPAICPDPFPTYPTCTGTETTGPPTCEVAVIGAGAGGLYTAVRYVDVFI